MLKTPMDVIERITKQMGREHQLWDYRIYGISPEGDTLELGIDLVVEGQASDFAALDATYPKVEHFHICVPVTFGEPVIEEPINRG